MRERDWYDVIVVGGGPAGLSAALVLGRSCRRVLVIDAGQPRNAVARGVHGYLTRDGTPPAELRELARGEVERYGVEVVGDVVVDAQCVALDVPSRTSRNGFQITTKGGRVARCRKLLLATGVQDDLPDIPGVRDCYGISVHHCPFCDGWEHRGKRLAAYGQPGAKAAGLGLALKAWSPHVVVLTGGQPLEEEHHQKLAACDVDLVENPVRRLVADGGRLRQIELDGAQPVDADALFFNMGQRPGSELPGRLGCEFRDTKVAPMANTSPKQKTSVPGLFLAGDADGDVQFAIVAAAEGATAAVAIHKELQDEDLA